jgi:hypothetical protein
MKTLKNKEEIKRNGKSRKHHPAGECDRSLISEFLSFIAVLALSAVPEIFKKFIEKLKKLPTTRYCVWLKASFSSRRLRLIVKCSIALEVSVIGSLK